MTANNGKKRRAKRCEKESKKMRKRSSGSQMVPSGGGESCAEKACKMSINKQKENLKTPDGTVSFDKEINIG